MVLFKNNDSISFNSFVVCGRWNIVFEEVLCSGILSPVNKFNKETQRIDYTFQISGF